MFRLPAALAALIFATAPTLAQDAIDYQAVYGTRDPVQCGPFTTLAGPAPTGAEAAEIYKCARESEALDYMGILYLIEDAAFQVGAGRPFGTVGDISLSDADQSKPLYPVRGTFTRIQCEAISDFMENRGANCHEYGQAADGTCYQTLFGEWTCAINGASTGNDRMRVPPRP
jgi:hypothetical protein